MSVIVLIQDSSLAGEVRISVGPFGDLLTAEAWMKEQPPIEDNLYIRYMELTSPEEVDIGLVTPTTSETPSTSETPFRKDVKHPEIVVPMAGQDGNAFAILARVQRALYGGGVQPNEVREFLEDAESGDYDHLLQTCAKWVTCE